MELDLILNQESLPAHVVEVRRALLLYCSDFSIDYVQVYCATWPETANQWLLYISGLWDGAWCYASFKTTTNSSGKLVTFKV